MRERGGGGDVGGEGRERGEGERGGREREGGGRERGRRERERGEGGEKGEREGGGGQRVRVRANLLHNRVDIDCIYVTLLASFFLPSHLSFKHV